MMQQQPITFCATLVSAAPVTGLFLHEISLRRTDPAFGQRDKVTWSSFSVSLARTVEAHPSVKKDRFNLVYRHCPFTTEEETSAVLRALGNCLAEHRHSIAAIHIVNDAPMDEGRAYAAEATPITATHPGLAELSAAVPVPLFFDENGRQRLERLCPLPLDTPDLSGDDREDADDEWQDRAAVTAQQKEVRKEALLQRLNANYRRLAHHRQLTDILAARQAQSFAERVRVQERLVAHEFGVVAAPIKARQASLHAKNALLEQRVARLMEQLPSNKRPRNEA